jgi:hypothetical protein
LFIGSNLKGVYAYNRGGLGDAIGVW